MCRKGVDVQECNQYGRMLVVTPEGGHKSRWRVKLYVLQEVGSTLRPYPVVEVCKLRKQQYAGDGSGAVLALAWRFGVILEGCDADGYAEAAIRLEES